MRKIVQAIGFITLFTALGAVSCKENPKADTKDSRVEQFFNYENRADTCWNAMMYSDDSKIENMKRLIKELQLIEGSDEAQLSRILNRIDSLRLIRYDRLGVKNSSLIDQYDNQTNVVLSEVRKLVTANPNASKYQLINQLSSEISLADDSVLFYRKDYDKALDSIRYFKTKHGKALKKQIPNLDSLGNFPQFRLVQ